jgi:hypothetical protein
LTEIEKTEAEEPSLELEQNEEYLENPVNLETIDEISNEVIEETVIYTDPMGNTFEALVVPPCAGHDAETEKEIEKETIEVTEDEFAIADNFDLDFNEETNEDVDSIPDFF